MAVCTPKHFFFQRQSYFLCFLEWQQRDETLSVYFICCTQAVRTAFFTGTARKKNAALIKVTFEPALQSKRRMGGTSSKPTATVSSTAKKKTGIILTRHYTEPIFSEWFKWSVNYQYCRFSVSMQPKKKKLLHRIFFILTAVRFSAA